MDFFDPSRLARTGGNLNGKIPLVRCVELCKLLTQNTGQVSYEMTAYADHDGRFVLQGQINTDLKLVCQRCLGELDYPIQLNFSVKVVENDEAAKAVAHEFEPCIAHPQGVDLIHLLEEEILLDIPSLPMHENVQCHAEPSQAEKSTTVKPFEQFFSEFDLKNKHNER